MKGRQEGKTKKKDHVTSSGVLALLTNATSEQEREGVLLGGYGWSSPQRPSRGPSQSISSICLFFEAMKLMKFTYNC